MTKQTLCMNPGPIEFEPRVLRQFAHEGISHVDPRVIERFGECLEMLRGVFLAPDGQPLVVTGSGTLGWDMVAANLLSGSSASSANHVLVVNTGYFGDHFADCLTRYGATVSHVHAPSVGAQPSPATVAAALQKAAASGTPVRMVTITHVDTSTGVLVDLAALAATVREHAPDALLVVDAVCALGGEELRMKDWDIDVVLTGSQKCVGVPAGLSLLMLRPRALAAFEKLSASPSTPNKYYVDWKHWLPVMKAYESRRPSYFATPAVNHVFALHEGLTILLEKGGMEKRFQEHARMSEALKLAITKALGCTLVTDEASGAHTLTCVRYPRGVGAADFLPKVVARGVSLAGGLHKDIKTEYFRIGHMGPSTRRLDHVLRTVAAIEGALIECGYTPPTRKGTGVQMIKDAMKSSAIPMKPCRGSLPAMVYHGCPAPPRCQVYTVITLAAAVAAGFLLARAKN